MYFSSPSKKLGGGGRSYFAPCTIFTITHICLRIYTRDTSEISPYIPRYLKEKICDLYTQNLRQKKKQNIFTCNNKITRSSNFISKTNSNPLIAAIAFASLRAIFSIIYIYVLTFHHTGREVVHEIFTKACVALRERVAPANCIKDKCALIGEGRARIAMRCVCVCDGYALSRQRRLAAARQLCTCFALTVIYARNRV